MKMKMKTSLAKNISIWTIGLLLPVSFGLQAQSPAFDPLLDPLCKEQPSPQTEEWNSSYMWYPGQLAAHLQKQLKQKSEARCTYVGYPGKFNAPVYHSYFRKTVKLQKETFVKWAGPKSITCTVNGTKQDPDGRQYTAKPGINTFFFEVQSPNQLPALIVNGEKVSDLQGWQISLDNVSWNEAETYRMYNKPARLPDMEQEKIVTLFPDQYIPLRNVVREGTTLKSGKHGRFVVDFRHLEVGHVKLTANGKGTLSFRVGESTEEALNENGKDFEQTPIPPYTLTGQTQEIILPEMALRYLTIESEQPCTISSIQFDAKIWPVDYQMQFECSDASFNKMWQAASATLHTSMHSFYLDGIKRDYLPWSMDAIESAFAGDYLFADEQVSRNGLSIALMPPNPQVSDLGIVDYPLHSLIGFKQNYLRYGDLRTSLLYKDRIIQMLSLYESIQDERGFISAKHSTSGFIPGWSTKMGPDGQGVAAYGQIMLYLNFRNGAYFARLWKEGALAQKYEKRADALRKTIMEHFWDDTQQAFINGYYGNGEKDLRLSHHAQYWAILADLFPTQHYNQLFDVVIPSIKYYKESISYEKGYEFLAYIKAGRTKDIFPLLNSIWGEWLEQGHTRFPENFSPFASTKEQLVFYGRPYGLSLCHGGNGVAPVVAALNGILGFSESEKNKSEYYLTPQLLHLDWVKARIPTKDGLITVSIHKTGTSVIEIPENCIVHLQQAGMDKPLKTMKKAGRHEFYY